MLVLFFYCQCACILLTFRDQNSRILNCTVAKLAKLLTTKKIIIVIDFGKSQVAETFIPMSQSFLVSFSKSQILPENGALFVVHVYCTEWLELCVDE